MTNERTTPELTAATKKFSEADYEWQRVHLAWQKGESSIENDRYAHEVRRLAWEDVLRIRRELGLP